MMLASENEYMHEASNTIFRLSADEQIRKRCLDREEYYQDLRNYERVIAQKDAAIAQKDAAIAEKDALLQETIAQKDATIAEKDALFQNTVAQKDALLQKTISETEYLRSLLKKHGINDFI